MKVYAGGPTFPSSNASYKNLVWENRPVPDILLNINTPAIVRKISKLKNLQFIESMNNSQVTVPRFSETSLSMPFSMLCPGISQSSKHHHLTLYKGQVWREKSYSELCNHNVLNVLYDVSANNDMINPVHKDGELYVPPAAGILFISSIPWDSEILQSFARMTNITTMNFYDINQVSILNSNYIAVGRLVCRGYSHQCLPPNYYYPWFIWTKERSKIQVNLISLSSSLYSHFVLSYFEPSP